LDFGADQTVSKEFEQIYPMAVRMKVLCKFMFVLCLVLIVTIPFAIVLYLLLKKSDITIYEDRVRIRWMSTCELAWDEFEALRWGGGGSVGAGVATSAAVGTATGATRVFMGKSIQYKRKGKKGWSNIALGSYQNPGEILEEITKRTGLQPD